MRAWAMGLQAGSNVPGRTFSSSARPSSDLSMLPVLQQTLSTSKPCASRIAVSRLLSSSRPRHVAMPSRR